MEMLHSILKIRTDASKRLGCVSMERISWSGLCFDFFKCPSSAGFSEKKATSVAEINAEQKRRKIITKSSTNTSAKRGVRIISRRMNNCR